MKNGRSVKSNKRYFLAALIMFCFQLALGVNSVHAKLECYEEMLQKCKNDSSKIQCYESEDAMEKAEYSKEEVLKADIAWYDENVEFYRKRDRQSNTVHTRFNLCYIKEQRRRWLAYSSSNQVSNSGTSSNQSSSAGSSSQSNKKANQQTTNSQSNQTISNKPKPDPTGQMGDILGGVSETQASSNSNDLSKMTSNQLIDIATEAENSGDYARAYLAELQLSKSPDPKVSRQGLRQVSFRLRTGQGVTINRFESHRFAMQAASLGDVTAHSYLCADYLNGKGVEENHRKALDYCLFAAERGDMKAQGNLGWLYESGEGVQHSPRLSNEWTCKAAAQGESTALNNVKKAKINCN